MRARAARCVGRRMSGADWSLRHNRRSSRTLADGHGGQTGRKRNPARSSRRSVLATCGTWPASCRKAAQTGRRQNSCGRVRSGSRGAKATMKKQKEEPLSGWRILTTRASKQSGGLAGPLREMGAEVIEIPTIEIKAPQSYKALDSALRNIGN